MRIAIVVEGHTEQAFKRFLLDFLKTRLGKQVPHLQFKSCEGRIPTGTGLKELVRRLLSDRKRPADAVIALTDAYTGSNPPDFPTARDAKTKMRQWVGKEPRFHPHVALHDFEAWLLPYWAKVQQLTGTNKKPPSPHPEKVNHNHPPSRRLADVFRTGPKTKGSGYVKTRDAVRILKGEDLMVAIRACPELKAFVNTILRLCGAQEIP